VTPPQIFVVIVILIPLALVAINRLRADVAALAIMVMLGAAQFMGFAILGAANAPREAARAIAGFSQPVVITLLGLFIVTRCLDKTGVTRWIAQRILAIGGQSETRLVVLLTGATALLSLFMNNLAAGALLLPTAIDVSRRTGIKPSKFLIPVAYGSLLGGTATYFTTANIIVSDLLTTADPPQAPLGVLDFTPTGGLITIAGIIFLGLYARHLPDREPHPEQSIARRTSRELEDAYQLGERLWEARVPPGSPAVGQSLQQTGIRRPLGIAVAAIQRGQQFILAPDREQVLRADDVLLIVGREDRVSQLVPLGLKIGREHANGHIGRQGVTLVEAVLAPRSSVEGATLKDLEFRKRYGFTAVALLREGRSYRTDVAYMALKMGDSLLMVGSENRLKTLRSSPDFIVLEPDPGDQPIHQRDAALSAAIILAAIGASLLGVPVYLAMLAAAVIVFLTGLLTIEEAYRTMEWQAIFLIAGMYSVSLAMVNTGLAEAIGSHVVTLVTPLGPLGLAAGAYLLTALLTQIMGGQVTALVTGPIAISAAIYMGTNPQAMAVAAAIGCSAGFFTPIAHPVNLLMIGPGNYRFSDFFRVGWGLMVVCFIMLLVGMVLFWRL
jgi:di/tricarboxylate transporter